MLNKLIWLPILGILALGLIILLEQGQPIPKQEISHRPTPPKISFSPRHPRDFNEAKSIMRQLYPSGEEFYCACRYNLEAKQRIDASSCGFKAKGVRSQRIEWEHVVPASIYGQRFAEWTQGHPACQRQGHMKKGRNCARETSAEFRQMEADLYNLLPVLGTLNAARSNYPYGEIKGEPRAFGGCDFEVVQRIVEPRQEIRGDIARIYFYMDARYPGFDILNKSNGGMMEVWNRDDPMDAAEREQRIRIEKIQGNSFFIGRIERLANATRP